MLIYKVLFPNGKAYIGQTKKFDLRKYAHIFRSFNEKDKEYKCIFHNAIRKYGTENIKWEIIEDDINTIEDANNKEIYYIKKFNTISPFGYNMNEGGNYRGIFKHNQETKNKISKANKGKIRSDSAKRNYSISKAGDKNPMFGKTGNKNPMFGRKRVASENARYNISKGLKEFWKRKKNLIKNEK